MRQFLLLVAMAGTACGGGGGAAGVGSGDSLSPLAGCSNTLSANSQYECRVTAANKRSTFALMGAPIGMRIQEKSGYLKWTPVAEQVGDYVVTVERTTDGVTNQYELALSVASGDSNPAGIYVAPNGDDGSVAVSASAPLATLKEAVKRVAPGDVIHVRGGTYRNAAFGESYSERSSNNLVRIFETSGTEVAPITITAFGNEYVTLESDGVGIAFKDSDHWVIKNLELKGVAHTQDEERTLELWWGEGDDSLEIKGKGITIGNSDYVTVENCLLHGFSGAAVVNTGSDFVTLRNSVLYDNAWWSTSGVHGHANSKPGDSKGLADNVVNIIMDGNLVFGNQSSMISHVFSKGFVTLEIDEGNGLHMQNNGGTFSGRFVVTNNLVLLNGKSGLGLNTVDNGQITNNSFYQNAQAVASAGELSLQSSESFKVEKNLFHALPSRTNIKDFQKNYTNVTDNYAVEPNDESLAEGTVTYMSAVFADPLQGDFSAHADVPAGYGVASEVLESMAAKVIEYGLEPKAAPTTVNESYVEQLRDEIIGTWPAPSDQDDVPNDLILILDKNNDRCYNYATRGNYPVSRGVDCP